MAELHYFPLLAGDWLSGEATTLMTAEQEGAFVRLLCHAWLTKHECACSLPDDDTAIAQMARLTPARWRKVGGLIKAQFKPVPDAPGRLRNRKQWSVYETSLEKHERRVNAGREGARARAAAKAKEEERARRRSGKSPSIVEHSLSNATSNASSIAPAGPLANGQQSESESESYSEAEDKSQLPDNSNSDRARAAVFAKLPAEYQPDITTLLRAVGAGEQQYRWLQLLDARLTGMHPPLISGEVMGKAIRQYLANGDRPNWSRFAGYLRVEAAPPLAQRGARPISRDVPATADKAARSVENMDNWLASQESAVEVVPDGE